MDTSRTDQTGKQSPKGSNRTPDQDRQSERDKARRLTERDTPDDASRKRPEASDADQVYRPDANVDNQQSDSNTETPGHNIPSDAGQTSGAQVTDKSSQKDNINDKADKARSERRNG
ncbi:hypothetical protein [Halomonas korlensis]|uniref:Uncharacterized protein n=1 Tax=Halomonas korlensis TaxID=463301 RepID=A0A1I7H094_9GAMM|nr:hypothetical protein [Halomonas korlensis]SFU54128.1 hypothetical protein SAMN04487955_103376 [Halomonas korlensis]